MDSILFCHKAKTNRIVAFCSESFKNRLSIINLTVKHESQVNCRHFYASTNPFDSFLTCAFRLLGCIAAVSRLFGFIYFLRLSASRNTRILWNGKWYKLFNGRTWDEYTARDWCDTEHDRYIGWSAGSFTNTMCYQCRTYATRNSYTRNETGENVLRIIDYQG